MNKLLVLVCLLICQIIAEPNPSVDWMTNTHQQNFDKNFKGKTLIFTTPWNKNGDILVQKYINKIDYYSPSIFDIVMKNKKVGIENLQNYRKNKQLYQRIKNKNPSIKIIPRLYIAGDRIDIIKELGGNRGVYNAFIDHIVKLAHQKFIDGFIWDTPFNIFTTQKKWQQVGFLIKQITNQIKTKIGNKLILINIANPQDVNMMNHEFISTLKADGFTVQNYGEGGYVKCLQNTIQFIQKSKLWKKKMFFVLPFFSKKNGNQLVSTQKVKESFQSNGYFDAYFDEICHIDTDGNKYQTPCPEYFNKVFEIIHPFDLGIWQGGNGLEQYYSLL